MTVSKPQCVPCQHESVVGCAGGAMLGVHKHAEYTEFFTVYGPCCGPCYSHCLQHSLLCSMLSYGLHWRGWSGTSRPGKCSTMRARRFPLSLPSGSVQPSYRRRMATSKWWPRSLTMPSSPSLATVWSLTETPGSRSAAVCVLPCLIVVRNAFL